MQRRRTGSKNQGVAHRHVVTASSVTMCMRYQTTGKRTVMPIPHAHRYQPRWAAGPCSAQVGPEYPPTVRLPLIQDGIFVRARAAKTKLQTRDGHKADSANESQS